jgi:hypothetical protein
MHLYIYPASLGGEIVNSRAEAALPDYDDFHFLDSGAEKYIVDYLRFTREWRGKISSRATCELGQLISKRAPVEFPYRAQHKLTDS